MVQKLVRLLLLGVFVLTLSNVAPVSAQEAAGITIVPPKLELFSNPGDTINETIRIKNVSSLPQTYSIIVEDFRSSGEEGQVVLEETESKVYSLRSWIKLSAPAIVVQPNEEIIYPFAINVPKDAEPGGHYASILFQIGSTEPIPGVTSVQSRVGALILLRTSGDVKEDANIESFDVPVYQQKGPVEFSLRVKNNGTTHIRPNGTIIITNLFGKKVAELPLSALNVFPGSVRKMNTVWEKENVFGIYTATLVATYGQQNLPLTATIKFTVASYLGMGLIILGGIAGYFLIVSLVQGRGRLRQALKVILTGK